jgi:hypothetical protein
VASHREHLSVDPSANLRDSPPCMFGNYSQNGNNTFGHREVNVENVGMAEVEKKNVCTAPMRAMQLGQNDLEWRKF